MSVRRDASHRPGAVLAQRICDLCDQQTKLLDDAADVLSADDIAELRRRIDKVIGFAFSVQCDEVGAAHDDYLADLEP